MLQVEVLVVWAAAYENTALELVFLNAILSLVRELSRGGQEGKIIDISAKRCERGGLLECVSAVNARDTEDEKDHRSSSSRLRGF